MIVKLPLIGFTNILWEPGINVWIHANEIFYRQGKSFMEIKDTMIKWEIQRKLLGITIDEKHKFDKQIDLVCKKGVILLYIIYRFRRVSDITEIETIHNIFILSKLNFCPIVWHFCDRVFTRNMVKKQQERAFRFLLDDKAISYSSLMEKNSQTALHI